MNTPSTRILRALLGAALSGALAPAQNVSQEQLQTQRAEKVAKEVFKQAKWTFDFDAARAQAKLTGKPIFAYFTRSYAH